MSACDDGDSWNQFLGFIQDKCSKGEFLNWIAPIKLLRSSIEEITVEVPNIFVREYLMENYSKVLRSFVPLRTSGDLAINFIISEEKKEEPKSLPIEKKVVDITFNTNYTFENFIEGPSNQFVKSAAVGVAMRPGKTFNPLFIHGGVGLGKTHLLHGIGHCIKNNQSKINVQCITSETFVNELVSNLRNKSLDKMKNFYRNMVDVLLIDDIQFLQNKPNFEEELCNTIECLINQNKQIVITSDKPPPQLQLSERMIARMEWGLVASIGVPELETRVAIVQHKAEQKRLKLPQKVAFFIAERVYQNVRQLEGAVNRLSAYARLLHKEISEEIAETTLKELIEFTPQKKVTVESILKSVSAVFEVKFQDLKGESRLKNIALARQVAMYLAKELLKGESLTKIASSFNGKTHSTLLHSWKKISEELSKNDVLNRQVQMVKRNLS